MSTDSFAAFLERMGHKVRLVGGRHWFDSNPRVFQAFPFHEPIAARDVDVRAVLGRDGLALRHACPLGEGRASYFVGLRRDPDYDFPRLTSKARNQTRRGLENCRVRRLDFLELGDSGLRLNLETLQRQGRSVPKDFEAYWRRYYKEASGADGAEAWGAFVGDELGAYLIAFTTGSCANILTVRSARAHLPSYPNNALLFAYLRDAVQRPALELISIGLEPIQEGLEALDHFKTGLGFQKMPIGQRVDFAPWLRPLLSRPVSGALQRFAKMRASDERMAKLAGLLAWRRETA